jgi:LmbE family N-acetylglucosaminyl deacetylase
MIARPASALPARHGRSRACDASAMEQAVADLGTILSVWAHPDDETFLAGGVMGLAREQGQRVVCVSATAGEHGTNDPVTWPPERLGRVRRQESAAAMRILGVEDHRWLDFEDGTLAGVDPEVGVARVAELLDEVEPDTVLTFGADGMTFHPDHRTIHAWVTEAWRRRGRGPGVLCAAVEASFLRRHEALLETWGVYMSDERPVGVPADELALHLPLDGAGLDRKLAALRAMPSQIEPSLEVLTLEQFRAVNAEEAFASA